MNQAYTGGCACGAIRYEIAAESMMMNDCQCGDCQRKSGTGHGPGPHFPEPTGGEAEREGPVLGRRRREPQRKEPCLLPGVRRAGLSDVQGVARSFYHPCSQPRRSGPLQAADGDVPHAWSCTGHYRSSAAGIRQDAAVRLRYRPEVRAAKVAARQERRA